MSEHAIVATGVFELAGRERDDVIVTHIVRSPARD
jgi:hypothetical protein